MKKDKIYASYTTKRLELRLSDPSFAKEVANYYKRNQDFLELWEPQRSPGFYKKTYQGAFLEEDLMNFIEGSHARFWIWPKGSKKIIGCVALNNIIMEPFCSSFLSYKLDVDYLKQGLMTEAIKKVTEIAFGSLELHRLEACIMPRNKASLKVVKKLGFVKEGLSKKYLKINAVWEDHLHFVLLNETEI